MTPQGRGRVMWESILSGVGILCCLAVAAVGSLLGYQGLAALLAAATFVLLRVLGSWLEA